MTQTLKRAKIIDSDNEEGEEGEVKQSQPLVDADGGEDSDEGIRDDGPQGYVLLPFILFKNRYRSECVLTVLRIFHTVTTNS